MIRNRTGRVALPGRLDDVALGGGVAPAHQPDHAGQERQRPFALVGEEALPGQPQAHLLDPPQQLPEAELLDGVRPEAELALALPQLAAAEDVHTVAHRRRRLDAVEAVALHRASRMVDVSSLRQKYTSPHWSVRLSSESSPSIQTLPSRPSQSATPWLNPATE